MKLGWKDLVNLGICLIPAVYLYSIWTELPESVPLHWNASGEIDRYGSKNELAWTALALPLFTYVLMLVIPILDPKKQIKYMGAKYDSLKMLLAVLMSGLAVFIVHSAKNTEIMSSGMLFTLIGFLFLGLGNYFQTIKPNYFIGIRTPWTLENEEVWKRTHKLGGRLWVVGGLLIILLSFIVDMQDITPIFIGIILVMSLIPVIYSYMQFRKISSNSTQGE